MKNGKRIESITIKRMLDDSPDLSYLGEYKRNHDGHEFTIDRKHTLDCPVNFGKFAANKMVDKLERVISYLNSQLTGLREWDDEFDILREKQDELLECNCDESGDWSHNELQFFTVGASFEGFNPVATWIPADAEDKHAYWLKVMIDGATADYQRMESYNNGDWHSTGVRAEAEIVVNGVCQDITSGGLWGIESDSDDSYFAEVGSEELAELKKQLSALGFSKRAIAVASKDARTVEWHGAKSG